MTISDLKSEKGVKEFDDFISSRSYVDGYVATQADIAVLEAIGKAPGDKTPHAKRWYKHISSFSEAARSKLPGQKKVPSVFTAQAAGPTSKAAAGDSKDDDDEVDLFGSDEEEDAEAAKIREERLKAYADKKSKKPALIAKSSVILEVKPWDDTTNMKEMETHVRSIAMDGLVWGASKLVPVGYGIHKLQIICVVEDEKVSIDDLQENIQEFEDFVQSVDVVGFNKI